MTLHLIKLCVGIDHVEDLRTWIDVRQEERRQRGEAGEHYHTTRMVPKRISELLDGGSLYWIIKGKIQARQKLLDIRTFTDEEGVRRCHLVLEPKLVLVGLRPRRPFQGWRYLSGQDAPPDLAGGGISDELPADMRADLLELCLI